MIGAIPPLYHSLNRYVFHGNYQRQAIFILLLTFFCYTLFHASRKPISVVKTVLHNYKYPYEYQAQSHGWVPFDQDNWSQLMAGLECVYLLVYASSMFISGHVAERTNLRFFLSAGMLLSGLTTILFGLAYYLDIHQYSYFMFVQILSGIVQATGWPAVVTLVGNWWGKSRRGFIMGLWNAHTSLGNIVGSVIAGLFVESSWGASFVVPGLLMLFGAIIIYLTLVDHPHKVRLIVPNSDNPNPQPVTRVKSEPSINAKIHASDDDLKPLVPNIETSRPITLWEALFLPNVFAYSLLLFFAKLVSYTFLYWLPKYLSSSGTELISAGLAAQLSVIFDLGGIAGGIMAGLLSDSKSSVDSMNEDERTINRRAKVCAWMLAAAAPLMLIYRVLDSASSFKSLVLLAFCGFTINGPYALVTTAVSADLGTQTALQGRAKALATITAIIDGMGSLGAAVGPFLTGVLVPYGWSAVFIMLIISDLLALGMSFWIMYQTKRYGANRATPILTT